MKKWLKVLLVILGVGVLGLVIIVVWKWPELDILKGTEKLDGVMESIPEVASAELKPLTKGEADWVCWRGAAGDGRSGVVGIVKDWSGGLEKLWEVDFLCQGRASATWSAPVVQGNRLVVCGRDDENDLIFCLDPDDGTLVWRASFKTKFADTTHGSGPRATPYIDDDRVYIFGRSGDLGCWNLLDGEELWRRNVGDEGGAEPRWGHSSSPLVLGDLVVVQGGGMARTIAYDKFTGNVVWKSGNGIAGYAAFSTLKLDGKLMMLVFHGKGLAGLDGESGAELWDIPWETSYDVNATTLLISGERAFITSGYNTGGLLLKISGENAETVWTNKTIASHHSDPYIIDGYLYGYSGMSNQNRGAFKCVELDSGDQKWSTNAMGWGTCVWVDEHLLCCDIKGNIYLMKPDPEKFIKVTELGRALGDVKGPVWTIPVLANGRLYLRCKQRLVCYDLLSFLPR